MKVQLIFLIFFLFNFDTQGAAQPEITNKLKKMAHSIRWISKDIEEKSQEAEKDTVGFKKKQIEKELEELNQKLNLTRLNFLNTATNINIETTQMPATEGPRNLLQEVQELVGPLIDGLKRISQRPRKIEKLKTKVEQLNERKEIINKALLQLDEVQTKIDTNDLQDELSWAKKYLINIKEDLDLKLITTNRTLESELGQKKELWPVLKEMAKEFFHTKGKHLFVALLVFILFYWSLMSFKKSLFSRESFLKKISWASRPLQAVYHLLTFALSFSAAILTLYAFNDWLLVTLLILLLLAVLWSAKQFLPRMIEEIRLLLNLSTVKEKQRITWRGVPWQVQTLGFYSILENPLLDGGKLKLAAKELLPLHSRPQSPHEPWFPSKKGDWVLLDDHFYGEVLVQSPETVVLRGFKGGEKYYPTQTYLSLCPENYSQGFNIELNLLAPFELTTDKCINLALELRKMVSEETKKTYPLDFLQIQYSGQNVDGNLLWLLAKFNGQCANNYFQISVFLKEIIYNYMHVQKIPFTIRPIKIIN